MIDPSEGFVRTTPNVADDWRFPVALPVLVVGVGEDLCLWTDGNAAGWANDVATVSSAISSRAERVRVRTTRFIRFSLLVYTKQAPRSAQLWDSKRAPRNSLSIHRG